MNVATLMAAMPGLNQARAQQCCEYCNQAMVEFQITTVLRALHWLAQTGHESVSLTYFEEIASGDAYEGRADLGNIRPGDGRRFKGRGPIQITGRSNYTRAGQALGLPLVNSPQLAAQPDVAFRVSAWWWSQAGCNQIADTDNVVALTRRINGGTNGLADRQTRTNRCRTLGQAVLPSGGPAGPAPAPPPEEDLTPDQAKQLQDIQTRVINVERRIDVGMPPPGPKASGFGAVGTLDFLLRDIQARLSRLEAKIK